MKLKNIIYRLIDRLTFKIGLLLYKVSDRIAVETLPQFGNKPKNLKIDLPRRIINPERIFIGDNVMIGPGSFLYALKHYPCGTMEHPERKQEVQNFDSRIIIGNRVTATGGLQVASQGEVIIEDDVMFASNVFINDALHGYQNATIAYKYQPLWKIKPIVIGKGSWIGQNVVILPGVTIEELCIIGANSVVTKSIPKQCIAIGSPARVIKKWDNDNHEWISV
jgi:acetyltransferase-like isoleucine patch superfamily enzyme